MFVINRILRRQFTIGKEELAGMPAIKFEVNIEHGDKRDGKYDQPVPVLRKTMCNTVINDGESNNQRTEGDVTGKTVEFEGLALYGQPPYPYQWDFGDGSTPSSEKNPTHIYEQPGKYNYTLTITDSSDFSDSFTETIEISGDSGDDEDSSIIMFVGIIVVIAVIGVIAVVYIIRR